VQASSILLDLEASLDKACGLIREAAAEGARLVVFPEAFLPGYPVWVWFMPGGHTHPLRELYTELHANSVSVPGPATEVLGAVAAECEVTVAIGVNERNSESSDSTLFNTLLYIGPDGAVLGRHRKLVPTSAEKLVWGRGDGSDLEVYDLPFGRLGGLICWENYMPLARYALTAWGAQFHAAPTWDRGEPWLSTMQYLGQVEGWLNPGGTVIVDPDGKIVAGPAMEEETILYADVRPDQLVGPRWQIDVAGNYARPDVFELRVHRRPTPVLHVVDHSEEPQASDEPPAKCLDA
jgi:nitrilase